MLEKIATELMTLDEFIADYHEQPFELVNGEKRFIMPNVAIHGWIIRALVRLLDAFCIAHQLGEIFQELPFVETYQSSWVKGSKSPDIMFFSAKKWVAYAQTDWQEKPFVLIPDFVVEVVSPTDKYTDIHDKIIEYQAKGIQLIWVIDAKKKRAEVYAGENYALYEENDTLTGGDILPGLAIKLSEIFTS